MHTANLMMPVEGQGVSEKKVGATERKKKNLPLKELLCHPSAEQCQHWPELDRAKKETSVAERDAKPICSLHFGEII